MMLKDYLETLSRTIGNLERSILLEEQPMIAYLRKNVIR